MQNWNSVVNISVRARAAGGIDPANLGLANPRLVDPIHTGARPPVKVPNLWVEKGVIWQLPNLLVGFTSYSAATHFFSSVKSLGYSPGSVGSYQGPFSAMDFPLLWVGSSSAAYKTIHDNVYYEGTNYYTNLLLWPSLATMHYAKMFLSMQPGAPYQAAHGHAASAGPVVPISAMRNFSANSPAGVQNFQAQYIMYAPGGSWKTTSASGISHDMDEYSWWAKTGQYRPWG
jgi:hypothetical protein